MTIVTMMRKNNEDERLRRHSIIYRLKLRTSYINFLLYPFTRHCILSRMMTLNKTHAIKDNSCMLLHQYAHQSSSQSTRFSSAFSFHKMAATSTDHNTKLNVV
ncbi:hypothetical protein I4U23_009709 [Adineta vaga]|nr:hypothetical protein I4U23_009709 [Adineta vaga]